MYGGLHVLTCVHIYMLYMYNTLSASTMGAWGAKQNLTAQIPEFDPAAGAKGTDHRQGRLRHLHQGLSGPPPSLAAEG